MGDVRLEREEDERYRKVDRVIERAETDRSDSHGDAEDSDRGDPQSEGSDE